MYTHDHLQALSDAIANQLSVARDREFHAMQATRCLHLFNQPQPSATGSIQVLYDHMSVANIDYGHSIPAHVHERFKEFLQALCEWHVTEAWKADAATASVGGPNSADSDFALNIASPAARAATEAAMANEAYDQLCGMAPTVAARLGFLTEDSYWLSLRRYWQLQGDNAIIDLAGYVEYIDSNREGAIVRDSIGAIVDVMKHDLSGFEQPLFVPQSKGFGQYFIEKF